MTLDASEDRKPRLAIIGCGSSGLISLKNAIDHLDGWDIVCFEKSDRVIGCWGHPYPGFVSTSTKYTTQFSCYPIYDASVKDDRGASRNEFFREDEYGCYLERFTEHFNLRPYIRFRTQVSDLARDGEGWSLNVNPLDNPDEAQREHFDQVIIATGLTAETNPVPCSDKLVPLSDLKSHDGLNHITHKTIVVMGGGESAVDFAKRLADPALDNTVYLSLKSGIRVSPRYHPVRGVPSDFLRNRLMLSIHPDMRNAIGQKFVEWRIRYQELFEKLFPGTGQSLPADSDKVALRKHWAYTLTKTAKDDLFNMFHNKSDDFLDAVAEGRITIIGPPESDNYTRFLAYDSSESMVIDPDLVVPAVGFRSTLGALSNNTIALSDFYMGCTHVDYPTLHAVGFARPIIGNIPSISEVQAEFICRLIAGKVSRPADIADQHKANQAMRAKRYQKLNLEYIYAVEMFPYCDQLARMMGVFPRCSLSGFFAWCRMMLEPATTLHYHRENLFPENSHRVYMPPLLIVILLILKPYDLVRKLFLRAGTSH